jgi:hypothetical protein
MNRFKIQYLLILIFPLVTSWIGAMLSGMQSGPDGISLQQISLAIALLTGMMAMFIRYLHGQWHYLIAIILSAIYASVSLTLLNAPISILPLFLINLAYALLTILIVRYIFYIKSVFRIRTILLGVTGALLFSAYLAAIYSLLTIELPPGFWNASFMYGLILYVFMGFGMSLADLVILQLEVKQLQNEDDAHDDK